LPVNDAGKILKRRLLSEWLEEEAAGSVGATSVGG
jgi:hypothetical protein